MPLELSTWPLSHLLASDALGVLEVNSLTVCIARGSPSSDPVATIRLDVVDTVNQARNVIGGFLRGFAESGFGDVWDVVEDQLWEQALRKGLRSEWGIPPGQKEPPPGRKDAAKRGCKEARSQPPEARRSIAGRWLPGLVAMPLPGDRYLAEFCVSELGETVGLRLLAANRRDTDDELADGVARGWVGASGRLFEELRAFPRRTVRKRLCCLVPAGEVDGTPMTRLDARLRSPEQLDEFRETCLPSLICDKSREVRRLARVSRRLCECPRKMHTPYYAPGMRQLEFAAKLALEANPHRQHALLSLEKRAASDYDEELLEALRNANRLSVAPSADLVRRALSRLVDPSISHAEADVLDVLLSSNRALDVRYVLGSGVSSMLDDVLVTSLLGRGRPSRELCHAVLARCFGSDEIAAELAWADCTTTDPVLRATLARCDHPQVLYTLAVRGVHEVRQRAFELLLVSDLDRAFRLASLYPAHTLQLSRHAWNDLLESSDRRTRVRTWRLRHMLRIVR